ncbi:hypothetical protein EB796_000599 [Bugula neritina]|uniref:HERC2 n=1 Tax=Bugula neritina TaxID=10212 RepID=A0A7J7KSH3_BUGNE|nr:hypothetical protein EB796_000599 [Bugula neritina]
MSQLGITVQRTCHRRWRDIYWGEGDYGRLGHGDNHSRNMPCLVRDVDNIGQVACGSSHTMLLAKDGSAVWSFGDGSHGKLGHGDTARTYRPKLIKQLVGVCVKKIVCGNQCSYALTSTGLIYEYNMYYESNSVCMGWQHLCVNR